MFQQHRGCANVSEALFFRKSGAVLRVPARESSLSLFLTVSAVQRWYLSNSHDVQRNALYWRSWVSWTIPSWFLSLLAIFSATDTVSCTSLASTPTQPTWLGHDRKTVTYVAVKISVAEKEETESDILPQLTNAHKSHPGSGIIMPVQFDVDGPNGIHRCIITPPARAVQDASHHRLFQLPVARAINALSVRWDRSFRFMRMILHFVMFILPSDQDRYKHKKIDEFMTLCSLFHYPQRLYLRNW